MKERIKKEFEQWKIKRKGKRTKIFRWKSSGKIEENKFNGGK